MILNRFTSIDNMLDMLQKNKLRLSKPEYWEDKNDAIYIEEYRKKRNLKKVFACCFTEESETIYHWSATAEKNNMCCIEFDGDELIKLIRRKRGYRARSVDYYTIGQLKKNLIDVRDIPFSKRYAYRNEKEFRIIFDSKYYTVEKYLPIKLSIIRKITINQIMNTEIYKMLKNKIEGTYKIKVNQSTIYTNKMWIKHISTL
jgi:hypothetical protein